MEKLELDRVQHSVERTATRSLTGKSPFGPAALGWPGLSPHSSEGLCTSPADPQPIYPDKGACGGPTGPPSPALWDSIV